jgi:hypothetical protein
MRRRGGVRLSVLDTSPIVQGSAPRQALHNTGELMVTTPVYHHADRRRSYELVASIADRLRAER